MENEKGELELDGNNGVANSGIDSENKNAKKPWCDLKWSTITDCNLMEYFTKANLFLLCCIAACFSLVSSIIHYLVTRD